VAIILKIDGDTQMILFFKYSMENKCVQKK
jgi:hypothetical protein